MTFAQHAMEYIDFVQHAWEYIELLITHKMPLADWVA